MYYLFLSILTLFLIYIIAIKPNTVRREEMRVFEKKYIAHRGLFDMVDHPENSLSAFRAAAEKGYGAELDVQLTRDNQLVVFHDASLKRMCGVDKILTECTYDEIKDYSLGLSSERIPLFSEVLSIFSTDLPLIIEVKSEGRIIETAKVLYDQVKDFVGSFCIESFHPKVVAWFKKNHPEIVRGQLSADFFSAKAPLPFYVKLVLTNLLTNFYAKPDFIAYHHMHHDSFAFWLCRKLYKVECFAWTIKLEEELDKAREAFQVFIFDSFIPKEMSEH